MGLGSACMYAAGRIDAATDADQRDTWTKAATDDGSTETRDPA
jgi:hypothetical protein